MPQFVATVSRTCVATTEITVVAENVDEAPEVASFDSPWEFLDAPATVEQVTALLRSLEVPYSEARGPSTDGPAVIGGSPACPSGAPPAAPGAAAPPGPG